MSGGIDLRGETFDKEIVTSSLGRSLARDERARLERSPEEIAFFFYRRGTASVIKFVRFWRSQRTAAAARALYKNTFADVRLLLPPADLKVREDSSPSPLLSSFFFPRRRHLREAERGLCPFYRVCSFSFSLSSRLHDSPLLRRLGSLPSLPLAPEESGSTPQGLHKGAWTRLSVFPRP